MQELGGGDLTITTASLRERSHHHHAALIPSRKPLSDHLQRPSTPSKRPRSDAHLAPQQRDVVSPYASPSSQRHDEHLSLSLDAMNGIARREASSRGVCRDLASDTSGSAIAWWSDRSLPGRIIHSEAITPRGREYRQQALRRAVRKRSRWVFGAALSWRFCLPEIC